MAQAFRIAIPARLGSTRLPGKALRLIGRRTLIEHVWHAARAAEPAEILIATDDERIAEHAAGFGAAVCLTRRDHASGTDRLAEAAVARSWADDDIVVNLQGDEPLVPARSLRQVAAVLAEARAAAVATLATPLLVSEDIADANLVKVVTDAVGNALYFSRAPIPFARAGGVPEGAPPRRHIGLYAYRAGFLRTYAELAPAPLERRECLEQLRVLWHGYRIRVADAEAVPPAGVDTEADIERVARQLAGD